MTFNRHAGKSASAVQIHQAAIGQNDGSRADGWIRKIENGVGRIASSGTHGVRGFKRESRQTGQRLWVIGVTSKWINGETSNTETLRGGADQPAFLHNPVAGKGILTVGYQNRIIRRSQ